MKSLITVSALFLTLAAAPAAFAGAGGSCHFHGHKPVTEAVVTDCALKRSADLVKAGKLDASWASVKPEKAELVDGQKGKEWKLVFKNPGVVDVSKQTLYIFFSHSGNYIAANHTGQ